MKKVIYGVIIAFFSLLLIINATSHAKAETDPERFVCLERLTGHSHDVYCVAFSQNNEWLASGSFDATIKMTPTIIVSSRIIS